MKEQLFEKLGLTKGEIKVYIALIRLGESTVGPLVYESKVTKSKIYDILEKLIGKGLVGYLIKSGTKHFTSSDPHMILEYISKKEGELKETKQEVLNTLPELLAQKGKAGERRIAEMYEGFHGVKAIRDELMSSFKSGETLLVLGAPKIANINWEAWFLEFHKKRIKNKINMKIIYNSDAKEYGRIRKKMKLTKVKYLPNNLISPNWIDIFPNAVLFVMILKNPIAFVIRDKDLAKSFESYFDVMWNNSISYI